MRKKGSILILLGVLMLIAALALTLYNFWDSHRAGSAAKTTVEALWEQIPQASPKPVTPSEGNGQGTEAGKPDIEPPMQEPAPVAEKPAEVEPSETTPAPVETKAEPVAVEKPTEAEPPETTPAPVETKAEPVTVEKPTEAEPPETTPAPVETKAEPVAVEKPAEAEPPETTPAPVETKAEPVTVEKPTEAEPSETNPAPVETETESVVAEKPTEGKPTETTVPDETEPDPDKAEKPAEAEQPAEPAIRLEWHFDGFGALPDLGETMHKLLSGFPWEDELQSLGNALKQIHSILVREGQAIRAEEMPTVEINSYSYIGVLEIDSLGLSLPVMSEWSYDRLQNAPCRYAGSIGGNDLVICGHNYTTHFYHVKYAPIGTVVRLTDVLGNVYTYTIQEIEILDPYALEEMVSGDWDLTLFTCTFNGEARAAVRCKRA